ncbi:MAG: hypothetical protein AAFU54_29985, partial [Chloroflexota bacterium]
MFSRNRHILLNSIWLGLVGVVLVGCAPTSGLPASNAGVVGSYKAGPLSVSVNSSGESRFRISNMSLCRMQPFEHQMDHGD